MGTTALQRSLILLLVAASSFAKPPPGYVKKPDTDEHPAKYEFGYEVEGVEGARQGHEERRDGELAEGRFFVDLPDGSTQTVTYTADDWGFHPLVSYSSSSRTSSSSAQIALGEKAVAALRAGPQTAVTKLQRVAVTQQQVVLPLQQQPQAIQPQILQPVVHQQVVQPQVVQPQIVQPQIVQPQIVQPVVQPQVVQPVVQPQVIQPQIVQPVVQPQIVQPHIVQPQVVQPQVVHPVVTVQPVQQQLVLAGQSQQRQSSASYQQAGAGVYQGLVSAKSAFRLAEEVNSQLVSSTATPLLLHQTVAVVPSAAPQVQEEEYRETSEQRIDVSEFGARVAGLALRPIVVADHVVSPTPTPTPTPLAPIVVADYDSQFVTTPRPVVTVTSAGAAVAESSSGATATPDTVVITPRPEAAKVKEDVEGEEYSRAVYDDEELHAAINALDDADVDVEEARRQEKLRAEHQVQLIKQALAETDARIQEQELKQARLKALVKTQIQQQQQQQQLFVVYGGRIQAVDRDELFEGESAKVSVKQLLEAEKIAEDKAVVYQPYVTVPSYYHHHQQQQPSPYGNLFHGAERYGLPRQRLVYPTRLVTQQLRVKKPLLVSHGGRWRLQGGGGGRNPSQLRKLCIEYGGFKPPIVPSKQIEEDLANNA